MTGNKLPADTVGGVDNELRNAASDATLVMSNLVLDPERFDELVAMVADDFVQQDHRKLIGVPEMDKAAWVEDAVSFQRDTGMESRERVVLAVRGDRLVLSRVLVGYRDDSAREFLAIAEFAGDPLQLRRAVSFDVDEIDTALAELDRLHAEIND